MKAFFGTLGFSILSAVVPIFNVEVYLVALATQIPKSAALPVAIAAGAGQALGKVLWYHGTQKSLQLPWMRKRMESERWKNSFDRWEKRIEARPRLAAAFMFSSALVGAPPLLVMGAIAGALRFNMTMYVTTIFVGRSIQSWVILAGLTSLFH
ncbi:MULTISPECIES: hypothetical protein [unclassified Nocardioides]|uniref:hypothetical protein n=1 Tax=unclassified Nocardioides TaxID=2615069 RepID=UPI0006F53CF6|nr:MULTISPECIES: hypothetical protein [unclassified Nocardioides]KQY54557.1 hypothetical protein ASD30_18090 [Nocardioides sp. Root140]KQZ66432.1 hypothetical protein ASD66_23175 [Nocardioides sp. Root151]KRF19632.1 hypothetical protein ASH02_24050 [Nocardioides sp. Soil796]